MKCSVIALAALVVGAIFFLPLVSGHGMMLDPISRNAPKGINTLGGSMWFSQGCSIGCTTCNDTGVPVPPGFPNNHFERVEAHSMSPRLGMGGALPNIGSYNGDLCPNDHSKMPGEKRATINDPTLTTMNKQSGPGGNYTDCLLRGPDPAICSNWSAWNPWRAPGSTAGFDPCGLAGGAFTNMSMRAGGFGPQTGYKQGFRGSELPPIPRKERSVWKTGGVASVSWTSVANHAGGYIWSMCPASEPLTEACFEQHTLKYSNMTHSKLRYMFLNGNGTFSPNRTTVTIPATRTDVGTFPHGSMWTKNPVPPGSWETWLGHGGRWQGNQQPPQFPPPTGCDEHCWGYQPCNVGFAHPSYEGWNHTQPLPTCAHGKNGQGCCHTTAYLAITDEVKVPDVAPGDYVVRWRWDCEQSPQIWSGCGDVTVVA